MPFFAEQDKYSNLALWVGKFLQNKINIVT